VWPKNYQIILTEYKKCCLKLLYTLSYTEELCISGYGQLDYTPALAGPPAGRTKNFVEQNGLGLKFRGQAGHKLSAHPGLFYRNVKNSKSAIIRSFQCINMKLLLKRVIKGFFHTDYVFLWFIVRSLLPVICYCFIQSLVIRISLKGWAGPSRAWMLMGLNGSGLINFGSPWAGPGLEYWTMVVISRDVVETKHT